MITGDSCTGVNWKVLEIVVRANKRHRGIPWLSFIDLGINFHHPRAARRGISNSGVLPCVFMLVCILVFYHQYVNSGLSQPVDRRF